MEKAEGSGFRATIRGCVNASFLVAMDGESRGMSISLLGRGESELALGGREANVDSTSRFGSAKAGASHDLGWASFRACSKSGTVGTASRRVEG